ncbi:MAG: hypothetical protein HYX41_04645 [Bdellovibrio sp.]|nr:hypothetical protein [Bdellovibrio sp.]
MILWSSVFLCLFLAVRLLYAESIQNKGLFGFAKKKLELAEVILLLREIEDCLSAGQVPEREVWENLKELPAPWGALSYESITALRESGGSLLPTLKRLRSLAEDQATALLDARSKTSQAFAQAFACASLVPILGYGLYSIVPGMTDQSRPWAFACGCALLFTGFGALWMVRLAETARWGGLPKENRVWLLGALIAGERFLAAIRCGTPPDLAWSKAVDTLRVDALNLSIAWGHSVWETPPNPYRQAAEKSIVSAGSSIKKSIQVSLLEGRPCTDRIESTLLVMRNEVSAIIERELSLLTTRALKPLFIFVAPSLLGLLFYGLWLTAQAGLQESLAETGLF